MSENRNFAAEGMKEFGAALGIDAGNGMLSSGDSRAGVWSGLGTINQGDASERHLRMECLKIATRHGSVGGEQDVHTAKQYYEFISGAPGKSAALNSSSCQERCGPLSEGLRQLLREEGQASR